MIETWGAVCEFGVLSPPYLAQAVVFHKSCLVELKIVVDRFPLPPNSMMIVVLEARRRPIWALDRMVDKHINEILTANGQSHLFRPFKSISQIDPFPISKLSC